jgi:glycerophosphoryl diester phosphodiesterase
MAAFRLAAEMGADGVELDVQLTADGEAVVIHDFSVDKTTNGRGQVRDLTLVEIQELDAGRHKGLAFAGEKIPMLAEVLQEIGPRLLLNIELKTSSPSTAGLEAEVVRLVEDANLAYRVLISSFNPLALWRVRRLNPNLWRGLLWHPLRGGLLRGSLGRWLAQPHAFHPYWEAIDRDQVAQEHRRDLTVNVWTCNEPAAMKHLAAMGVDAILTDRPDLLGGVLRGGPG